MSTGQLLLPPELVDAIIDYLHNDKRTLAACSLVCKACVPRSRYHLFDNVTLRGRGNLEKLLKSGTATFPFIRRIQFEGCSDTQYWDENLPLLVGFESIRTLSLPFLFWHHTNSIAQSALITQFTTIVRLNLHQIEVATFSQLAQMICAYPLLETLVIDGATWSIADTPPSTLCLPPNLRALELLDCPMDLMFEWLLSHKEALALHALSINGSWTTDFHFFGIFLQALGSSLKTFMCQPHLCYESHWLVTLDQNTQLRSVHFTLSLYLSDKVENTRWVTRMLSQITSAHMDEITFENIGGGIGEPNFVEWSEVDALLELRQFSKIKMVVIRVEMKPALSEWFATQLPKCCARGILRVCQGDWTTTHL